MIDDFAAELGLYRLLEEITVGSAAFTDEDDVVRIIHGADDCDGCWNHTPSPHALAYAPVAARDGLFYRHCDHGELHHDTYERAFRERADLENPAEDGCDGSCRGPLPDLPDGQVYELPADAAGLWEVRTEHSKHLFDLDEGTWTRYPGRRASRTRHDGGVQKLEAFGTRPRMSRRTLVWYGSGRWAVSSTVVAIQPVRFVGEAPPTIESRMSE